MPKKQTHEEFLESIKNRMDEYDVLEVYKNNSTKIRMYHKVCEKEFEITPNSFKVGCGCFHCFGKRKKTREQFEKEILDLVGDEYTLKSDYVANKVKVLMKHNACGNEYFVAPSKFLIGRRCPKCAKKSMANKQRKSLEKINEELLAIHGGYISLVGEYKSNRIKALFKDSRCGHEWYSTTNCVIGQGTGCSICDSSKGELYINTKLNELGLKFVREYRFDDCSGITGVRLPFDFALFDTSGNLKAIIEYDGKHHFEQVFGEEDYERTVRNDAIKDKYCSENNINLIRIPYWKQENLEHEINIILTELELI